MSEDEAAAKGPRREWPLPEADRPAPAGPEPEPIRIGVSTCLLGQNVRYDGGHKEYRFLTRELARYVEFVPTCPEVEVGMPTPRPTIRLVRADELPGGQRLVCPSTGEDHTDAMRAFAEARVEALRGQGLCGYVLKASSPSCGMERVRLYDRDMPSRTGVGLFAQVLLERWPELPVEEEGRLHDPFLRETFLEAVFATARLRELFRGEWKTKDFVAFHTAEKLSLLAHDPEAYRELGRLVARQAEVEREELRATYTRRFLLAFRQPASRGRHVNVLQHMLGYFKDTLSSELRHEVLDLVEDFRAGLVPLAVPLTLLRHHVRAQGVDYLAGQTYLDPAPKRLKLRSAVL